MPGDATTPVDTRRIISETFIVEPGEFVILEDTSPFLTDHVVLHDGSVLVPECVGNECPHIAGYRASAVAASG